jgi:hypothetical protein
MKKTRESLEVAETRKFLEKELSDVQSEKSLSVTSRLQGTKMTGVLMSLEESHVEFLRMNRVIGR